MQQVYLMVPLSLSRPARQNGSRNSWRQRSVVGHKMILVPFNVHRKLALRQVRHQSGVSNVSTALEWYVSRVTHHTSTSMTH